MSRTEQDTTTTVEPGAKATVEQVAAKATGIATFEQLKAKPRRVSKFDVHTLDDEGVEIALTMKYKALSSKEYDKLIEAHPPTSREKAKGAVYNVDTFAPALIAAVSAEPKLSEEQAAELYNSPEWSGGEVQTLFVEALKVCNAGLNVPFNERD